MKMKLTTLTLLLVAAGSLFAPTLAADPGRMHQVSRVRVPAHSEDITEGSSVNFVRQMIGSADLQLTPNLWRYHNFRAVGGKAGNDDCRELVLHFVNDRVAGIYLADRRACKVITRRITTGKPELIALVSVPEVQVGTEIASVK